MKLIFESLNDYEMSRLELATLSENFKGSYEKGKKWIIEQISKFVKFIKDFINKHIRRIPKDVSVESLDISKLKKPKEFIHKLGEEVKEMDTAEKILKPLLKMSSNYTVDDSISTKDNLIKGLGMKQMYIKEIAQNMKTIEQHLREINRVIDEDDSLVAAKSLLSVYNTILSIITMSSHSYRSANYTYKDNETFMESVKNNDVFGIKSSLETIITKTKADKNKCDAAVKYAMDNSDFDWEEDDGNDDKMGIKDYGYSSKSEEYIITRERMVQNFTKERYNKVLELFKYHEEYQSKKFNK